MKRVAFILPSNPGKWLGGLSYLRNLLKAILANPDHRIEPVLLARPGLPEAFLSGFPAVEIIRTFLAIRVHPVRLAASRLLRFSGRDMSLEWLLRRYRIDALSHSEPIGARSPLVSIGWIPDFQHVRIPQFFSQAERDERDKLYSRLIEGSRRIILSSNDARSDFAAFAPGAVDKARVLHFVSGFEDTGNALAGEQLRIRFGIDRPYFHLPNQFWAHKNHAVVIEALGILKSRGIKPLVLATGKPADYRNPGHFERLMARAKELGVESDFRALGMVTLPELQSLMINSLALINPSSFEGWSTTVEESRSLGLPIILSDIPVHVEQAPPLGRYFEAGSAADLAEAMAVQMRHHDPDLIAKSRAAAALDLPDRVREFGRCYEDIATAAIAGA